MNIIKLAFVAGAGIFAMTACSGKDTGDTAGGPGGGDCNTTLINSFNTPSCTNRQWRYQLVTQCWAGEAYVNIYQTGTKNGWVEEGHAMNSESLGDNSETWGLDLAVVDTVGEVAVGATSLFQCDEDEAGRSKGLTWNFDVYDLDFAPADCVNYGHDPAYIAGCANGNSW